VKSLSEIDRSAIATHYGFKSLVAFTAALVFCDNSNVTYEGFATTPLFTMEIPAIVIGIFSYPPPPTQEFLLSSSCIVAVSPVCVSMSLKKLESSYLFFLFSSRFLLVHSEYLVVHLRGSQLVAQQLSVFYVPALLISPLLPLFRLQFQKQTVALHCCELRCDIPIQFNFRNLDYTYSGKALNSINIAPKFSAPEKFVKDN
jgi:hypothetical protein